MYIESSGNEIREDFQLFQGYNSGKSDCKKKLGKIFSFS